jgi:hypothetical protein
MAAPANRMDVIDRPGRILGHVEIDPPEGGLPVEIQDVSLTIDATVLDDIKAAAEETAELLAGPLAVTGPLTDAQLRAAAVPVSGPLTDAQLRAAAVPISAAALPLPNGAATDAKVEAVRAILAAGIDVTVDNPTDVSALATAAKQDAQTAVLGTIAGLDYASDTRLASVETILAQVRDNTANIALDADHLSIEADAINLNTDGVEARLDTLIAKDYATQTTAAAIKARADLLATEETLAALSAKVPALANGRMPVDASGVAVPIASLPALPAGNNNIGNVDVLTLPGNPAQTADVTAVTAKAEAIRALLAGTLTVDTELSAAGPLATQATLAAIAGQLPSALAADRLKVDASGVAVPVTDNAASLTVDAPVGTPVAARLSDGAAFYDGTKTGQLPAALVAGRLDVNLGASGITLDVNSELPAAAAPTDSDANPTVPSVAANLMAYDRASGLWRRVAATRTNGGALNATNAQGMLAVGSHIFDPTSGNFLLGVSVGAGDAIATTGAVPLYTPSLYNNTTVDRQRNNNTATLLASAARTATTSSSDQTNYNNSTLQCILNVTAVPAVPATGGLTLKIEGKDPISGNYYTILTAPAQIQAVGAYVYEVGLGLSGAAEGGIVKRLAAMLPRTWRATVTAGDSQSYTYSVGSALGVAG